ncbi:hypothetical protein DLH55_07580, partial [Neisseria gonorrhoeae]
MRGNDGFRDCGVVGTQPNRHSHGSGNLGRGVWATVLSDKFPCGQVRIPACAGMTGFEIAVLSDGFRDYGVVGRVSRLRCCRNATEPSFPRK